MIYVAIYVALYLLVFIFDIVPQIKARRKKSLSIYLPVYFFTLTVNILYSLGFNIPSPAVPIHKLVDSIFRLN